MSTSIDIARVKARHRRFVRRALPVLADEGVAAGAEVIAAEARARIRIRSGRSLASIRVHEDVVPVEAAGQVGSAPPPARTSSAVVSAGDPSLPPVVRWLELGTQRQPARPFLRPALDAGQEPAVKATRDVLARGIPAAIGNHGVAA